VENNFTLWVILPEACAWGISCEKAVCDWASTNHTQFFINYLYGASGKKE
jgi:hypothetical protein